jgi:hypothetical protein
MINNNIINYFNYIIINNIVSLLRSLYTRQHLQEPNPNVKQGLTLHKIPLLS